MKHRQYQQISPRDKNNNYTEITRLLPRRFIIFKRNLTLKVKEITEIITFIKKNIEFYLAVLVTTINFLKHVIHRILTFPLFKYPETRRVRGRTLFMTTIRSSINQFQLSQLVLFCRANIELL